MTSSAENNADCGGLNHGGSGHECLTPSAEIDARYVCPKCGATMLVRTGVVAQWCRQCRVSMTRVTSPGVDQ